MNDPQDTCTGYYPVLLDLRGKRCLVVGGGAVAVRKVRGLLGAGADVTVISPTTDPPLERWGAEGRVRLRRRHYTAGELRGFFLVIGATDDEAVNGRIGSEALAGNVLCNIVDRPKACSFILPSIVRRRDLIIAVSTSGKSPAYAKRLRRELEKQYGPEHAVLLDLMGALRGRLLAGDHAPEAHKALFEQLLDGDLLGLIRKGDAQGIEGLLCEVLGRECRLGDLFPFDPAPLKALGPGAVPQGSTRGE